MQCFDTSTYGLFVFNGGSLAVENIVLASITSTMGGPGFNVSTSSRAFVRNMTCRNTATLTNG